MKSKRYIFILLFCLPLLTLAQRGNNGLIAALEVAVPTGDFKDYKTGLGVSLKGLYGIGEAGQLTLTTGYSSFKAKVSTDEFKVKTSMIPFLAGYRHHFSILYVEPQLGFSTFRGKVKMEGGGDETTIKSTESGFTWALGAGVIVSGLDLGVRYQRGHPGEGANIGFFGFRAGFNLLGRRR